MSATCKATFVAVILSAVAAGSAPALAGICRIERVVRTGPASVKLFLAPGRANDLMRRVRVSHAGAVRTYGVTPPSSWRGPESARPGIDAELGDRITSSNPACEMTVARRGGAIGLQVSEIVRNPQIPTGLESMQARDEFVPAQ